MPPVRHHHTHYDLFRTFVPITGNTVDDYSNPISCLLEIQPASLEIEPSVYSQFFPSANEWLVGVKPHRCHER